MIWIAAPTQRATHNVRSKIEVHSFGANSLGYAFGTGEAFIESFVYQGAFTFLVKVYREDLSLLDNLINPRVCLLRIPKRKAKNRLSQRSKGWTHPTHLNGSNQSLGQQYGDGTQSSGTGSAMNPIATEWQINRAHENATTVCTLNPLDWYRPESGQFGDPVLPMSLEVWQAGGIKLRGLGSKTPEFRGITKQFRFKVRIEAEDPSDPRKRIFSSISQETVILYPRLGTFSTGGPFDPQDPNTFRQWFYSFDLKLANY